jgi:hypothetical protein
MVHRTCRFPGCRHPAHRCDIDHSIPYPQGPTSADNLCCRCRHHHRLKHHSTWTIHHGENSTLTWTSPTGRHYTTQPEPILVPTSHHPTIEPPADEAQQREDEPTADDPNSAQLAESDDEPPF